MWGDCECSLPSSLAIMPVFAGASNLNCDLSSWDVSLVTRMEYSKLFGIGFCESNREWKEGGKRWVVACVR